MMRVGIVTITLPFIHVLKMCSVAPSCWYQRNVPSYSRPLRPTCASAAPAGATTSAASAAAAATAVANATATPTAFVSRGRRSRRPRAAVAAASSITADAAGSGPTTPLQHSFHRLPDGMRLELLHLPAASGAAAGRLRLPLLFLHGSYHSAWCYAEHWMPFFAAAGFPVYAVSLRGQGGSDRMTAAGVELAESGTLDSLVADVAHVVASLPAAPVLVAHSSAGLIAQRFLLTQPLHLSAAAGGAGGGGGDQRPAAAVLAGVACVSAVPPSGNGAIVGRVLRRSLVDALRITW